MGTGRAIGVALVVAGALGLTFSSFSFTKESHKAALGPIELSVEEKETVNVPRWAGLGALVVGGVLVVIGGKKR